MRGVAKTRAHQQRVEQIVASVGEWIAMNPAPGPSGAAPQHAQARKKKA